MVPDEADYLSDGSLELVRRVINDKAQTGVALAGLLRLKYKLENLRNDHQQLTSRVGVLLEVKRLAKPDAVKVIEGVWKGLSPAAFHPDADAVFAVRPDRLGEYPHPVGRAPASGGACPPETIRIVSDPLSRHERAREGFTDAVWNMTGGTVSTA
jgi:hypothetical protein